MIRLESEYKKSLMRRPGGDDAEIDAAVATIMRDIRERGDEALIEYASRFDRTDLSEGLFVTRDEIEEAESKVSEDLKKAILSAYLNIKRFHEAEVPKGEYLKTAEGVECWRKIVPIERIGLYVPGGTAPLFSTVLMLAVPAKIAGSRDIILATPARDGVIHPAVLYAAKIAGVDRIIKAGGAQAIAAFAFGTKSISRRDKILGPGNRYVSYAKMRAQNYTSIDMLAGPSEVMVVADEKTEPRFVASDLLSQAEHGSDSQVMLLIKARNFKKGKEYFDLVERELSRMLDVIHRKEYAEKALENSKAFVLKSDEEIIRAINDYAPEHLILSLEDADKILPMVENAGSIFMGPYSPESAGDYASGTNHTLPTSGFARNTSGVSVDTFIKKITVQRLAKEGLRSLRDTIVTLAEAEGLEAHALAVKERIDG